MEKINNVVKSPIAPRNTNAVWVNPEDDTIKHFDHKNGWMSVGGDVKLVTLTKSEYKALVDTGTTDPKTLYIISDVE